MTDINGTVTPVPPLVGTLGAVPALSGTLTPSAAVVVTLTPTSAISAGLGSTVGITGTPESVSAIVGTLQAVGAITGIVDTMGLSSTLVSKLNSVEWGARAYQPDFITLVRSNALGVETGDATPWTLTASMTELVRWRVDAPAWRGSGVMDINVIAKLTATAARTVSFEIQTADDFPTGDDVAAASYGLPQAWTTVATFTTPGISVSGAEETLYWTARLIHEGNTYPDYRQVGIHATNATDTAGAPTIHTAESILLTTIDTSKDVLMRIRCSLSSLGSVSSAKAVAAYVSLSSPRDGHAY